MLCRKIDIFSNVTELPFDSSDCDRARFYKEKVEVEKTYL